METENLELMIRQNNEAELKAWVADLNKAAELALINDRQQSEDGATLAKLFHSSIQTLEKMRKELTAPMMKQKKQIDTRFKYYTEQLEDGKGVIKTKLNAWLAAEAKRLQETKSEAFDTALERFVIVEDKPIARSEVATAQTFTHWKYEVVNADAVPREYCEPSAGLIWRAVQSGTREIAGVKIWEETSIKIS